MTSSSQVQFRITQLKLDKMLFVLESILVLVLALFVTALLPQLLFKYMFADQALTEAPKVFEYIPVVAFVVGVGFCAYALVTNIMRWMKVRQLEASLMTSGCEECGADGECMCDMKVEPNVAKVSSKKTPARKTTKK